MIFNKLGPLSCRHLSTYIRSNPGFDVTRIEEMAVVVGVVAVGVEEALVGAVDLLPVGMVPDEEEDGGEEGEADAE